MYRSIKKGKEWTKENIEVRRYRRTVYSRLMSTNHLLLGFRLRRTRSSIRDEVVAIDREIADQRDFFALHLVICRPAARRSRNMQMRLPPNG